MGYVKEQLLRLKNKRKRLICQFLNLISSYFYNFSRSGKKMTQPNRNNSKTWDEVSDLKDIGAILRKKRKQMKLTQNDAAGLCNVGTRFISELENGKPMMHFDKALKVLKRFGFTFGIRER
jgi:HTH-type transcriptional regulator/antitoxin HipB